jgi:hypothetical protein
MYGFHEKLLMLGNDPSWQVLLLILCLPQEKNQAKALN